MKHLGVTHKQSREHDMLLYTQRGMVNQTQAFHMFALFILSKNPYVSLVSVILQMMITFFKLILCVSV